MQWRRRSRSSRMLQPMNLTETAQPTSSTVIGQLHPSTEMSCASVARDGSSACGDCATLAHPDSCRCGALSLQQSNKGLSQKDHKRLHPEQSSDVFLLLLQRQGYPPTSDASEPTAQHCHGRLSRGSFCSRRRSQSLSIAAQKACVKAAPDEDESSLECPELRTAGAHPTSRELNVHTTLQIDCNSTHGSHQCFAHLPTENRRRSWKPYQGNGCREETRHNAIVPRVPRPREPPQQPKVVVPTIGVRARSSAKLQCQPSDS